MSKSPTAQPDRRWLFLSAALLAVVTLLYFPVANFPFLQIDDNPHLLQEDLAHIGAAWSFTNPFAWQPLTWMSHQMDFQWFGFADAGPHHLMSLILHLANTGKGGHNFTAPQFFAAASGVSGPVRNGTVEVPSHKTIDVRLIPAVGTYELRCSHFLHSGFGMKGQIVVR